MDNIQPYKCSSLDKHYINLSLGSVEEVNVKYVEMYSVLNQVLVLD